MNGDNQELDWLQAAFKAPAEAAPEPHPEPDTIWSAVRGELPPNELREVVEHTAMCASCAEDWRLAAEFSKESVAEAARPAANVVYGRFRQWRPLAAVAAMAAGILIVVGLQMSGPTDPGQEPGYRNEQRTEVRSLLPEGQALPRQAAELRWSPVPGASLYNVQVTTEDLRVVASQESLSGTEYRLPESALTGLPAGSQILWQVEAVFPDGTRQTSETFFSTLQ
ncbi:MAG TPA: zf-HC2 domain-containing protein [Thermoanaerobaculia bacterium]|nr:zf-HC2 domain-containing protein [Thermoanaerobaculia bacterium]